MSLEGIEASVREALKQTAPSDDEVVALMRVAEQRRFAANTEQRSGRWSPLAFFSKYKLLIASTCAGACGAFVLWQGVPQRPQVMMTRDVWSAPTALAPKARETLGPKAREPRTTRETLAHKTREATPPAEPSVARATALVPSEDGRRASQQPAPPSPKKATVTPTPPVEAPPAKTLPAKTPGKTLPTTAQSSPPAPTQTPASSSKTKPAEPRWEDVAKAMREGRDEQARELITQLQLSSDAETRDNARLANLQLAIDALGATPATPEQLKALKELEQRGTTSSVRASARRLLRRLGSAKN